MLFAIKYYSVNKVTNVLASLPGYGSHAKTTFFTSAVARI
jgi:hypothetical protein